MEGDRIWSIITLAMCCVLLYFSISSSQQIKSLLEENAELWEKIDTLQSVLSLQPTSTDVAPAATSAPSLLDEIITDLGNEYQAAKKAALKTNFNYQYEAPARQSGIITYRYTRQ